ncbi:MAG: hypothetical protein ACUVX9_12310 [Anaerolineae bacterium]
MATEGQAGRGAERGDHWTAAAGQAGRWVGLHLDLAAPRTWCGPSWAFLGGLVASGDVPVSLRSLVVIAVAWMVCEPILGTLLSLALEIARLRQSYSVELPEPPQLTLPYAQPGAPGQRLLGRLLRWAARVNADWRATEGLADRWLLLALLGLVLSAVVGGWVPLLALLALLVFGAAATGRPLTTNTREALAAGQFLVAWLVGRAAFLTPDYLVVLVGLGLAIIWYAWTRRPPQTRVLASVHVLLAGLLAVVHVPLSAGAVLLLAVPLLLLTPEGPSSQRTYLQQTQVYLMISVLAAAWGLAWAY